MGTTENPNRGLISLFSSLTAIDDRKFIVTMGRKPQSNALRRLQSSLAAIVDRTLKNLSRRVTRTCNCCFDGVC